MCIVPVVGSSCFGLIVLVGQRGWCRSLCSCYWCCSCGGSGSGCALLTDDSKTSRHLRSGRSRHGGLDSCRELLEFHGVAVCYLLVLRLPEINPRAGEIDGSRRCTLENTRGSITDQYDVIFFNFFFLVFAKTREEQNPRSQSE